MDGESIGLDRRLFSPLKRAIKYTHPETQQDDALHATNYALQVGVRMYNAQSQY